MDEANGLGNRAKILTLLRGGPQTVNELAEALAMTDNGVRGHLANLQEEGLVKVAGERPGVRKPHQLFGLTDAGYERFPNAEGPLLNHLLLALEGSMSGAALRAFLRRVGGDMAVKLAGAADWAELPAEKRVNAVLRILGKIGGVAEVQERDGQTLIQGKHCPLAGLVARHPEACAVAQGLIEAVVGGEVEEQCQKGRHPCCRFALTAA